MITVPRLSKFYDDVSRRLTFNYVFALVIIAVSNVAAHVIVQQATWSILESTERINIAGKLAISSEQLIRTVVSLEFAQTPQNRTAQHETLIRVQSDLEQYHRALHIGDATTLSEGVHSETLSHLFDELEPSLHAILGASRCLVPHNADSCPETQDYYMQLLYDNEAPFLRTIKGITDRYQTEALERVQLVDTLQTIRLVGITVIVVALGGLVFRPAVQRITRELNHLVQTRDTLRVREEHYRFVAETATDMITQFGKDGTIMYVSGASRRLMGCSPDELRGKNMVSYVHPDDQDMVQQAYQQAKKDTITAEFRVRHADGRYIWVESTVRVIYDARQEQVRYINAVSRDITERKQSALALQESEHKLRTIISNVPLIMFIVDKNGVIQLCEGAGLRALGLAPGQNVGCSIVEIYPNHPQIVELIKRALGGEMLHLVGNEPSDLTLETWLQPLIGEHGKPDGVLGVAIDVTERVRADTALQQQSELLQRIIDNIPVMINVFDAQGKLSLINREHERILGYPFEQVSVREQMSRYYPDPDVLKSVMEFIATPDSGWRDFPTLTKNGQMIHTSWANVRLSDGAVLGIGQDISERVRIARELQSAKEAAESANRAKSMFLANMSHELRTPLNVILGFAQLLEREPTIKPDQQNHLRVIARSGEHLLSLINDVLEMSKIEIGNVPLQEIDFDLHRMLEGIQEMLRVRAENKQISLQLLRAPEVPQYIHADERKLRQVIINLLTNAIKFTDEGGVTMRIQYHRGFGGTARLIFEVEDTGRGIKPERLAALFEPFARLEDSTSKEGTGLGLALSRQFARMMGGEVVLRSEVGRGTLAHFEILIADGANIKPPQDPVVRRVIGLEAGQHALRVLIAEDNMDSRLLLSQAMRSVGFEVRVVENGVHCVQVAAQWHPHLIWMDMRMPEMDGYEATRQIKKGKSAPVIVAITASAFDHERANVLAAGCDDFIAKPFQIDWLFECMRKHLHVRFRYADTTPVKTGQLRARLDTGLLSTIPPDLLRALKVAAVELDSSRMYELITRVRNYDENVANALYNNAKSFRFDRILEELERVEGQKQS